MQQAPLTVEWLDIPTVPVGDRFHARLRFSHPVTGLEANDPRLRRTDGTFFSVSSSEITFTNEGNNTYLLVFNMTGRLTGSNTYVIRLPRNKVNFVNGTGPGGRLDSDAFTINVSISPTASISFDVTEGVAGVALTATIEFNQPVSGLSETNFTAANGTVGTLTAISSTRYEVEVTPDSGNGTLTLTLAADSVNEGNAEATVDIAYAEPAPTVTTPSALQNLRVTNIGATHIDLAWDASANNGGAAVEDHEVSIEEGASAGDTWIPTGSTNTTFRASNLKKGTQYTFQGRALNSEGAGDASAPVTATTDTTISGAPTHLRVVPSQTEADASWREPTDTGGLAIDSYEGRIVEGATIPANAPWQPLTTDDTLNAIFTGLKKGTDYAVEVRGVNSDGEGASSGITTFTTLLPAPPVWQTGSALRTEINAGETRRINIGAKVSGADTLEEIFGMQFQWMEWDETAKILTLTDAPIIDEDTDIRIRFIARNAEGEAPADVIITFKASVFATLHKTLFFVEPLNYEPGRVTRRGTQIIVTELTDNDYTTFSRHTDFDINLADANGNATGFNYIFIKAKGQNITYTLTPIGGSGTGLTNRRMPETY